MLEKLKNRLKMKLPGESAHLKMSPKSHNVPLRKFRPSSDARLSAVMVLLKFNRDNEIEIPLTLRSEKLSSHSKQISFPGGMAEEKETPLETALRETEEEIGIKKNDIEYLGELSRLYVPPTNFIISPIVGLLKNEIDFKINPDEVAEIIHVPYKLICDVNAVKYKKSNINGLELDIPYWEVHKEVPLWGATAMILSETYSYFR
jgi:8-oxo-dGTP pyrophosphatase MutT (NUDIX family)